MELLDGFLKIILHSEHSLLDMKRICLRLGALKKIIINDISIDKIYRVDTFYLLFYYILVKAHCTLYMLFKSTFSLNAHCDWSVTRTN